LSMLNQNREFELDDAFENNSYESVNRSAFHFTVTYNENSYFILNLIVILKLISMELDSNKATANCAVNYFYSKNKREIENDEFYDFSVSKVLKLN
jgi:hypothetical protein